MGLDLRHKSPLQKEALHILEGGTIEEDIDILKEAGILISEGELAPTYRFKKKLKDQSDEYPC